MALHMFCKLNERSAMHLLYNALITSAVSPETLTVQLCNMHAATLSSEAGTSVALQEVCDEGRHPEGWVRLHKYLAH